MWCTNCISTENCQGGISGFHVGSFIPLFSAKEFNKERSWKPWKGQASCGCSVMSHGHVWPFVSTWTGISPPRIDKKELTIEQHTWVSQRQTMQNSENCRSSLNFLLDFPWEILPAWNNPLKQWNKCVSHLKSSHLRQKAELLAHSNRDRY